MSKLNLIVIEKDKLHHTQLHYRYVINLINNLFRGINSLKKIKPEDHYLDAGYVIIDFNLRMLFFSEDAFSLKDLKKDILKFLEKKSWFVNYYR
ncbi:MAG: hypothetical protein QGH47_05325 [Candidatus Woesearchaeota archaeon]|jgi:hypothetical protein|nr:hypothetical protein [Candidatus Woesearchaeota archaeon]|tara:strand:- start:109 stop:390 length:282 start_codon:yes stop_codon:yes gene_type:complete